MTEIKIINALTKIFNEAGYSIEQEAMNYEYRFDILASKDNEKYAFEIKIFFSFNKMSLSRISKSIQRFYDFANKMNYKPVFVVFSILTDSSRSAINKQFPDMTILDISNLLYIVQNTPLRSELVSAIPYCVDDIEPRECKIKLDVICHGNKSNNLILELKNCINGYSGFRKFEDICYDILQYVFSDDLTLWERQKRSNDDLFRFDLICRIKDNNNRTFWSIAEKFFNSKYVVFEFKNYTDMITQKEIYTTERYLYSKALRNVGIIVAKNGYDDNSLWAAKGCLRENGKLIIILTADDLKELCMIKAKQDDPAEYLQRKLDELLIELEK